MQKKTGIALAALLSLALVFPSYTLWQALKPSLAAVRYLESVGYSSVRILYTIPEGRGCSPDDEYRLIFDAIPLDGERRVEGKVCGDGESVWYEE